MTYVPWRTLCPVIDPSTFPPPSPPEDAAFHRFAVTHRPGDPRQAWDHLLADLAPHRIMRDHRLALLCAARLANQRVGDRPGWYAKPRESDPA